MLRWQERRRSMPTLLVLSLYAIPYVVRLRRLRALGRPVPGWRAACFAGGLACLALAESPWIGGVDGRSLTAHMGEHVLIGDLAPLLLVLGCSGPVLAPLLRNRLAGTLRRLGHPGIALPLWVAGLYAWHLPFAYEAALANPVIHVLQHATFFALGFNLWLALLGPLPKPAWFGTPARLGWVTAAWLLGSGLGALLVFSTGPLYGAYPSVAGQSAAGAVMMVEQAVVAVSVFSWLFLALFRESGEHQELSELAAARGLTIEERRLARAAAAGGGGLRRRLEEL